MIITCTVCGFHLGDIQGRILTNTKHRACFICAECLRDMEREVEDRHNVSRTGFDDLFPWMRK